MAVQEGWLGRRHEVAHSRSQGLPARCGTGAGPPLPTLSATHLHPSSPGMEIFLLVGLLVSVMILPINVTGTEVDRLMSVSVGWWCDLRPPRGVWGRPGVPCRFTCRRLQLCKLTPPPHTRMHACTCRWERSRRVSSRTGSTAPRRRPAPTPRQAAARQGRRRLRRQSFTTPASRTHHRG